MPQLISDVSQLIANIQRYNAHAEDFAEVMPYNRAWYAWRNGKWLLGPSKFVGYEGMSPEEYLGSPYSSKKHGRLHRESATVLDGRVTEGVLSRWSELVAEGHPKYPELHTALNELCGRYGKKPNSLARISIVRSEEEAEVSSFSDDLVDLLAIVFRQLNPAQKSAFRKKVAD